MKDGFRNLKDAHIILSDGFSSCQMPLASEQTLLADEQMPITFVR
jgi:hypothetical protein